jgi:hypothetical protein
MISLKDPGLCPGSLWPSGASRMGCLSHPLRKSRVQRSPLRFTLDHTCSEKESDEPSGKRTWPIEPTEVHAVVVFRMPNKHRVLDTDDYRQFGADLWEADESCITSRRTTASFCPRSRVHGNSVWHTGWLLTVNARRVQGGTSRACRRPPETPVLQSCWSAIVPPIGWSTWGLPQCVGRRRD